MNRFGLSIAALALAVGGCKSTCCKKPVCATCPPLPPAPVQLYSPSTSNAAPEVWMPSSPAAPTPATSAPAPTFPTQPQASKYSPVNPSRIANLPAEIKLEQPEFSETNRREATSLKLVAGTADKKSISFVEITAGKLATGPRPTLDELDRLARSGYRRAFVVAPNGIVSETERRVFANRGLAIEAAPSRIQNDEPTYVFADDASQLIGWWTRHFQETEFISVEAAKIRAERLFR